MAVAIAASWAASGRIADAQIVRWNIEATVLQIDGPEGVFGDVRIGDPVRGWLSYHLAAPPDEAQGDQLYYFHPLAFPLAGMVIENPRLGEELAILGDVGSDCWTFVNNDTAYLDDEVIDYVLALQSAAPPPGVEADYPVIAIEFQGRTDALPNARLPLELDVDDWDAAVLSFTDLLGDSAVYAEIYALTKVEIPIVVGDLDFDGDVDASDLATWSEAYGSTGYLDGDADLDFDADGADFLAWQRQLGQTATNSAAVPEPPAAALAAAVLLTLRKKSGRRLENGHAI